LGNDAHLAAIPIGVVKQYLGSFGSVLETLQAVIAAEASEQQDPIELMFTKDPLGGDKL